MYTWEELVLLMRLHEPGVELPPDFWEKIEERRERKLGKRFNVASTQFVPVVR